MKYPNFYGAVHECLGVLFMVSAPDEVVAEVGDLVKAHDTKWYFILARVEDDNLEYYLVRRATLWERLFGGRRGSSNQAH